MPIELNIIKEQLSNLQEIEEKVDIYARLSEAGLNPKDYNPQMNDYMPFLLKIAIDGELRNFLDIIEGNYDLFASKFKVLHPSYLAELADKYNKLPKFREESLEGEKLKTKMIAIGFIARNTTNEEQDAMIEAFKKYEENRRSAVEAEKAKQMKLVG